MDVAKSPLDWLESCGFLQCTSPSSLSSAVLPSRHFKGCKSKVSLESNPLVFYLGMQLM